MRARARNRWKPVLVAFVLAFVVAVVGGLTTDTGPWYQSLRQPPWKPPDWAFAPAWTAIFALAALAGARAWQAERAPRWREGMLALFLANAFLNVLWSLLFFRLHRPDWALWEVALLWLSVLALIVYVAPRSRAAAWLLVPYLVWVAFAAWLNLAVVRLNAPFA